MATNLMSIEIERRQCEIVAIYLPHKIYSLRTNRCINTVKLLNNYIFKLCYSLRNNFSIDKLLFEVNTSRNIGLSRRNKSLRFQIKVNTSCVTHYYPTTTLHQMFSHLCKN